MDVWRAADVPPPPPPPPPSQAVMETAISAMLSHPNIVQTYTYMLYPIMATAPSRNLTGLGSDAGASREATGFGQGQQGQQGDAERGTGESGTTGSGGTGRGSLGGGVAGCRGGRMQGWHILLVLEHCTLGSLGGALASGLLPAPWPDQGAAGGQRLEGAALMTQLWHTPHHLDAVVTMLDVAVDVACAMMFLHDKNIVHADLKVGTAAHVCETPAACCLHVCRAHTCEPRCWRALGALRRAGCASSGRHSARLLG